MNKSLTKTCVSCGQLKPLAAFLQLAGHLGARYGNVCSTCRKAGLDKPKPSTDDEKTRSSTGFKIDSKTKIHGDIDKKLERQEKEELYHEERDEMEERTTIQIQKKETIAKNEKKHRENQESKRSFLERPRTLFDKQNILTKEQQIDFSVPFADTQIDKEKYKSSVFREFRKRIGKDTATAGSGTGASIAKENKDTLTNHIIKTWSPSSKKR